ncbi:MAG: hypothetical protein ACOXZ6_07080 [Syntrophomonadaceae bacterium]|jgi:hypothetical protein|nr:hypothetical protein [Bacillota bacterium]NLP23703.1 hypothetical protein [Syntrophomonadaceae bacterium]
MITLIGFSTSQTQAASALTDLRNRGYEVEATLVRSGQLYEGSLANYVNRSFKHDGYAVTVRCASDEAGHIREHLGELHGLDHLEIIPENN